MRTAQLNLRTFNVICPHCLATQTSAQGSEDFVPDEVEPGQVLKCTGVECGLEFRLPTTLRATPIQTRARTEE